MKILVINTVDTAKNGITSVIFNYVQAMNGQGVAFDLVSKNDPDESYVDKIEQTGGSVYVLPRSIKKIVKYIIALNQLVQKNKYDVVHIHGNSGTCILEAIAVKAAKTSKIIVHAHNTTCKYKFVHMVFKPFLNMIINGRLACSEASGYFLFGNNPFQVLNNAVDVENYRFNKLWREDVRKKHDIPEDMVLIGHVGTFSYQKNHEFLIEVFRNYHGLNKNSSLILIGEGKKQGVIRDLVKTLGLEEFIYFIGGVDNVNQYFSAFDCFLLPSRFEGLPLVLLEAQASGISCLTSTAVTNHANITGNVKYADLGQPIGLWMEKLTCICDGNDRDKKSDVAIQLLSDCGYNIRKEADRLKRYYLDVCS